MPRTHPREPRHVRGINRWRAWCGESRTPGSEGSCTEKARVHPLGTRDLAVQLTLPPLTCPRTTSHVGRCTPWRAGWAGGLAVGLWHGRGGGGGGAVVFHAPAGPVDGDDVAVVEEPVEDGGGEDLVGEDLAPFAEGLVAGDDDGAFLVAAGDDLEDEVGVA